jgi:O-succinylbenzoic acid--CoA ligase
VSVVDVLAATAGTPESAALVAGGRSWTYAELEAAVDARAELRRAGLRAAPDAGGAVVPFTARPDAATIVELLALWRVGAIPVPLNARLTEAEASAARTTLGAGHGVPEGTQVVLWTSGTSGRPRGVALSYGNLAAISDASRERLSLGPEDVWLSSLSPAHVGGLVLIVRSILLGGTLVAPGDLDLAGLSAALDGAGVDGPEGAGAPPPSHVSLVPTQLHRLLDLRADAAAPAALRCALIGGAHTPAGLLERALAAGWPIALTYGATEMSSQIATAPPELVRERRGTVGAPMPGVEVRISASGEIECRGPTRALGYVATGGAQGPPPLADADGWYATGDLGSLDDAGHLRVTGRRVDRIVSGGVTLDAVEVEEALRAHPAVVEACVVGVPDPEWGERVAACVVPVEGEFDVEETTEHLRGVLMAAKVPRLWRLAAELPRNANGKVDRAAVRALLSGA